METLTEEFCVEIAHVATRDGGAKDCVTIGEDKKATFQIRDDDSKRELRFLVACLLNVFQVYMVWNVIFNSHISVCVFI